MYKQTEYGLSICLMLSSLLTHGHETVAIQNLTSMWLW